MEIDDQDTHDEKIKWKVEDVKFSASRPVVDVEGTEVDSDEEILNEESLAVRLSFSSSPCFIQYKTQTQKMSLE